MNLLKDDLTFTAKTSLNCRFIHQGQWVEADLFDITASGMKLKLGQKHASQMTEGESIDQLYVLANDQFLHVSDMTIESVESQTDTLQLQPSSDQLPSLDYLNHLLTGEPAKIPPLLKIPDRGVYSEAARLNRLRFVEELTGKSFDRIAQTQFEAHKLNNNIENLLGSIEIPVGLAGPLLIHGVYAKGVFYAPFATTEGALVASATRGALALSEAGGVTARVIKQRMMRVPIFVFKDIKQASFFARWIESQLSNIHQEIGRYSRHAKLTEFKPFVLGRIVHVHFIYETGDAAGQNMTTICTWQVCRWILEQIKLWPFVKLEHFQIEGNRSSDKKVSFKSFINTRGTHVVVEAVLSPEICIRNLRVTPEQLFKTYHHAVAGAISVGMVGMNINVANVIAAMFAALGQDMACVHESSLGQLFLELMDDGHIYCSLTLPSLVVGSVGGGTHLPPQLQCLDLISCSGANRSRKLAEIIASFALALDLSTLAAVASDHFARAHERLGRNRPVAYLKKEDLNSDFFQRAINMLGHHPLQIERVTEIEHYPLGISIITELTAHRIQKLVGHFAYTLHTSDSALEVMVKIKPLDQEVILMVNSLAAMCDAALAEEFNTHRQTLGFEGCHRRELAIMRSKDPRLTQYMPVIYGIFENPRREAFVLVEECLKGTLLMDSADNISGWDANFLHTAIHGLAEIHSIWLGREQELLAKSWLCHAPNHNYMVEKKKLWHLLWLHAHQEFPEWFNDAQMVRHLDVVSRIDDWWAQIDTMPKTLVHNDFNPRNITFRHTEHGPKLCVYDWELATLHIPQRDLVELLVYTLEAPLDAALIDELIERHRCELEAFSVQPLCATLWRQGYRLALYDMLTNRIAMYLMAHTFRSYPFMERIVATLEALIDLEESRIS